ncbi:ribonuclease H-like domain-containing protein [Tanacetum coccineum]
MEGVMTKMPITTAKEKATKRLEVKARSSLLMGIPYEHQLKFNSIKDDKKLLEAVEKRFGGNEATKKTKRNLLKQQYENFTTPSSKMLDQTFDRLQKLLKWNTHVVWCENKADYTYTMSMDDLYNNLQVYEPEVKGMSSSSSSTQIMAFVSSSNNNTSSTNEATNTAHGVSTASTQCYNCHKRGHFARECRAPRNQDNKNKESSRRSVPVETSTSTALVSCDGLGGYDWSDQAKEWPNYALVTFSSSNLDSEVSNNSICSKYCSEIIKLLKSQNEQLLKDLKKSESMVLVPPPYTGNFMPPTPDLSFTGFDEFVNNPLGENYKAMSSEEEPKEVVRDEDSHVWSTSI